MNMNNQIKYPVAEQFVSINGEGTKAGELAVFIRFKGKKPCYRSVLAYIISYRQHNGFHEQCVEQIFADIWQNLQPDKLMVYATYTRRGGLDINPCRVSDLSWMPKPIRLARQ